MSERTYTTKTGRVLSSVDFERLADEAEAGYGVPELKTNCLVAPKPEIIRFRCPGDLLRALETLAETEETSVNEVVLDAVKARVTQGPS